MAIKRGDLVTMALRGDYGKPRPALVIQSDHFQQHHSITVLPLTSEIQEAPLFRITVEPSPENGLQKTSQIMVDKTQTLPTDKVGESFGYLAEEDMRAVNLALLGFFGLLRTQ